MAGSLTVVPAQLVGSQLVPIAEGPGAGDPVELIRPIQGGHVLFIGALVRGASGNGGSVRAELRRGETDTGQPLEVPGGIIVFEERTTALQALDPGVSRPDERPGWQQLRADISDLANIPACPNFLPVEIPDHTLYVKVVYTDSRGNTGTATRKVVPRCTQTDVSSRDICLCECRASYTIDRCLAKNVDAGSSD